MPVVNRLVIPGIISGILSSILISINNLQNKSFTSPVPTDRSNSAQAGFQLIGLAVTLVLGTIGGVIIGYVFKLLNKNDSSQLFNVNVLFIG